MSKRSLLFLISGLFLGAMLLSFSYDSFFPQNLIPVVPAPDKTESEKITDFSFSDMSGTSYHLTDFRGKMVILNFWATWCPPCIVEFPVLVDITEKYKGQVVLIALSSDKNTEDVQKFMARLQTGMDIPLNPKRVIIGMDRDRQITRDLFRVNTYPESFIIAPDGTRARHIIGIHDWEKPEIKKLIADLVANNSAP